MTMTQTAVDFTDQRVLVTGGAGEVSAGEADVAILYGAGACAGLTQRRLACEALFPVAAPGPDLPRRPEDLVRAPLIVQPEHPWRLWLEQVGLSELPVHATLTADSPLAALELARRGGCSGSWAMSSITSFTSAPTTATRARSTIRWRTTPTTP